MGKRWAATVMLMFLIIGIMGCNRAPMVNYSPGLTAGGDINGITLGSKYEDVVQKWGEPSSVYLAYKNGGGALNFRNNYYKATFINGKLYDLDVQFEGSDNSVPQKEADRVTKELLPTDSKFIRRYKKSTSMVYVYKSQWLSNLFEASNFYDNDSGKNQPGMFIVNQDYNNQGQVLGLTLGTGNNP